MKQLSLRKLVPLVFVLVGGTVLGYPQQEKMSEIFDISHEEKTDGTISHVVRIHSTADFHKKVVKSSVPVVVRIYAGVEVGSLKAVYQDVAESFKRKVVFTSVNIAHVADLLKMIMFRFKIPQIALPVLLFYQKGTLHLEAGQGAYTKEKLLEVVNKRFFASAENTSLKDKALPVDKGFDMTKTPTAPVKKKKKDPSTWQKLENFGKKLKRWLFSLKNVSQEVKAYQSSRRWKSQKTLMHFR